MLLRILSQTLVFVGLALSQQGEFPSVFQGSITSIAQLTTTQTNFAWTNTSVIPPEATVEIQLDGLVGSGVINLTNHAGFTAVNLTTLGTACNPVGNLTAASNMAVTQGGQQTSGNSATATLPTDTSTLASTDSSMAPPPKANSSLSSMNASPPLGSGTSANVSLFTGAGTVSRTSPSSLFTWLRFGPFMGTILLVG